MTLYSSVRSFLPLVCSSSSSSSVSFCLLLLTFSILSHSVIIFLDRILLFLEGAGSAGITWQLGVGSGGRLRKEFWELKVLSLGYSDCSTSRAFSATSSSYCQEGGARMKFDTGIVNGSKLMVLFIVRLVGISCFN